MENLHFFRGHVQFLEAIAKLLSDPEKDISKLAYKALVNLTADQQVCDTLVKLQTSKNCIHSLIEYVLTSESIHADLACSVICNLTRWEGTAPKVVEIIKSHEDISFEKIVQVLCTEKYNENSSLEFLGMFLSNLSQVKETRKYILDKEKCVVQRLLPYTHYDKSIIKRRGIVAALHNCCFESEYHEWLLSDKVDVLPSLLLPLAGPEELDEEDMDKLPPDLQYLDDDKTREPVPEIRKMLLETLFQLCSTKFGRDYMKEKNVYVIMRELHKWEEDKSVSLALENLVSVLIGDEPTEKEHENLQNIVIPEHIQKQLDEESEKYKKEEKIPDPDSEVLILE